VPVGVLGILLVRRYIREDFPRSEARLDWLGFILSSISIASLVMGFEAIGHRSLPPAQLGGLIALGLVCGLLYIWHARRASDPIIDLSLLRVPTFAISVLGGNLCRFAIGATPFLLAIMLQVGFGLSAFAAGLITFTGAAGALLMKVVASPIIRRFGFKNVLIVNAIITGIFIALCALFRQDPPAWIMMAILVAGGFFRSLQFTAVNTLTFADLDSRSMSRASSFSAMAQQLGISLGVATAAVTMNLSMYGRGAEELALADVIWGFIVIGVVTALSALSFLRLPANA